jgi:hypothetical protein
MVIDDFLCDGSGDLPIHRSHRCDIKVLLPHLVCPILDHLPSGIARSSRSFRKAPVVPIVAFPVFS